jgi:hypothetical protein
MLSPPRFVCLGCGNRGVDVWPNRAVQQGPGTRLTRRSVQPLGQGQEPGFGRDEAGGRSRLVPVMKRPEKITFREMRASGVRGLLIYCSD